MNITFSIFVISIILFGCSSKQSNKETITPTEITEPVIDSLKVMEKITSFLEKKYGVREYSDSNRFWMDDFAAIDTIINAYINDDEIQDYFIILNLGGWPLFEGHFFDGRNGEEYDMEPSTLRPAMRFSSIFDKIDYTNSRKNDFLSARLVNMVEGEFFNIYRYNEKKKVIEEVLNFDNFTEDTLENKEPVYSEIFDFNSIIGDTINFYEGKFLEGDHEILHYNITQKEHERLFYFIFDEKTNKYIKHY